MPMVYDLPTAGASPLPLQHFDAPEAKNFAAAQLTEQGQAVTKAGVVVTQIQQELQDQIDTATTKESDNALADFIRVANHDPEKGYLAKAGKAALTDRSAVVKSIQERAKEIEAGLSNDVQRYMFKKAAAQRMQSALLQIDSHAMNQAKIYNGAEAKARMDGARRDALSNWAGWEESGSLFQTNKKIMLNETESIAEIAGIPKDSEQYAQFVKASTTQLHSDVLNNMISLGQTTLAKKYYNAHIREIMPDKLDELNNKVKVATTATDADNLATKVWGEFAPADRNGALPLFQMTQRARELAGDNEDVQKAAIAGIRERAGEWNGEQAEFKSQNISGVWKQIDGGVSMKKIQLSSSWLALTDVERHDITRRVEEEATVRANRAAAQSSKELSDLQRQEHMAFLKNGAEFLTATDPNVLKRMSRAQVEAQRGKFGMTATQHLLDKWDAIQNPAKYGEAKMDDDDFKQVAQTLKLDPLSKNKDTRNQIGALKFHVEQVISQEQTQAKRPLTRQEKMDLVNKELSKQVLVNPGIFSPNVKVPVIALTRTQAEKVVIPAKDRDAITAAMKIKYGQTNNAAYAPTEANLRRFYLMSISPAASIAPQGVEE